MTTERSGSFMQTLRDSLEAVRIYDGRWRVKFEIYEYSIFMTPEEANQMAGWLTEAANRARREQGGAR